MKKLLVLLVFTPFLILSQDHVEHNLIGWTIDNKIVYEEESSWFFNSNYEIIVQNLVTDKIEDIITISEGGDGDCGNEFLDCPIYIDHNNNNDNECYLITCYIHPLLVADGNFCRAGQPIHSHHWYLYRRCVARALRRI